MLEFSWLQYFKALPMPEPKTPSQDNIAASQPWHGMSEYCMCIYNILAVIKLKIPPKHNTLSDTVASASQASHINLYNNLKSKMLKWCANIYFNKQCLKQGLTPNFAKVKIPRTSPVASFTQHSPHLYPIKCCVLTVF